MVRSKKLTPAARDTLHAKTMIESKFNEFFRSPAGVILTLAIIMLFALSVFFFTHRVFQNLLRPQPYIME